MSQAINLASIKADLHRRIAALDRRAPSASARELAPDVDAIRALAHGAGLNPAVTVTHFVASALARGERGALVSGWLPVLQDAVASERQDVAACCAYAAACSVRLAG